MTPPPDRREYHPYPVPSFSNWTVTAVRNAIEAHEHGQFAGSSLLWEQIQRNPRIASATGTRVLSVLGLPFHLASGDGDGRRNDPAVNKLKPFWPRIAPSPAMADLLRWAVGLGVGLGELVWRVERGQWIPRLKVWHPAHLYWLEHEHRYYLNTQEGLIPIEPGDGHWVLLTHSDHRPWQRGVVRVLGIEDTIRGFAVRDWARYSEIHGIPTRVAKVPRDASDADKTRFVQDVANLGSESTILATVDRDGQGFGLEIAEASDQSWEGFERLIARCDEDAEIAIIGQTFSSGQKSGVYVAKANALGVRQDVLEADAHALAHVAREQITKPWARFNLGEDHVDSAPCPEWDAKPPPDLAAEAATVKALGDGIAALNAAGGTSGKAVDFEAFVERFGVPLKDVPKTDPSLGGANGSGDAARGGGAGVPGNGPAGSARGVPGVAGDAAKPGGAAKGGAKLAALDALGDGQVYVDDVADAAVAKSRAAVDPILARVVAAVDASTSYEDLRARLRAVLEGVEVGKAQRLVRGAILMAEAAGAWSVHAE